jgi:hypothetical protein
MPQLLRVAFRRLAQAQQLRPPIGDQKAVPGGVQRSNKNGVARMADFICANAKAKKTA